MDGEARRSTPPPAAERGRRAAGRRAGPDGPGTAGDGGGELGSSLSWLRWVIVATMLLIVVTWPVPARAGHPLWPLVVAFAVYNLLLEFARRSWPRLRSFAWVPFADLPVVGLLYALDAEPGGPLFAAFFLAVVTAATCWSPRGTALYLAACAVVIVAIAPSLPQWEPNPGEIRQLASRLVILALVGIGAALFTQRLTRQAAAARLVRDEAERLEALDRLRSAFVASVSHDLRTPLTAAQAGLGFLASRADDRLTPEERELLVSVRRSVERLRTLIDDLLTAVQIEGGVLEVAREPVDPREVVADAVTTVHPLFRQKGQHLDVDLPELPPVPGDAGRLSQVVVNLLANAHAHTPAGTRVHLAGARRGDQVVLCVRDSGPGVPAADRERVFERFCRLGTGGTAGLGLSNARGIVEAHGGRIWAEAGPEGGAAFCFTLPAPPDPPDP